MEQREARTLLKSFKVLMEQFGVSFREIFHFSLLLLPSLWGQESRRPMHKAESTCRELRLCFVKSLTGGPAGGDAEAGGWAQHVALI